MSPDLRQFGLDACDPACGPGVFDIYDWAVLSNPPSVATKAVLPVTCPLNRSNLTEGDVPPKRLSAGFRWTGAPGPGCVNWRRGHAGAIDEAEKASATGTGS